jgi:hypothetical protein
MVPPHSLWHPQIPNFFFFLFNSRQKKPETTNLYLQHGPRSSQHGRKVLNAHISPIRKLTPPGRRPYRRRDKPRANIQNLHNRDSLDARERSAQPNSLPPIKSTQTSPDLHRSGNSNIRRRPPARPLPKRNRKRHHPGQ